jgi:hypothetical protein
MLTKKQSSQTNEKDWFYFSSALAPAVASDYMAMRLLFRLEPITTATVILGKALDVAEKSLKLFVSVSRKTSTALSSARSEYGHNIEKLRIAAAAYDTIFDEDAFKTFSQDLNDKSGQLYQMVRYGSEKTTDGFEANLATLIPVIDRIFFHTIHKIPEHERLLLFFVSPLKNLMQGSHFDQTRNRELVLDALRWQNAEYAALQALWNQLDTEHALLAAGLDAAGEAATGRGA